MDLQEPSKLMMQQVCDVVNPQHIVRIVSNAMPQEDIEHNDELLVWCKKLNESVALRAQTAVELIHELTESKKMTEVLMKRVEKIYEESAKSY